MVALKFINQAADGRGSGVLWHNSLLAGDFGSPGGDAAAKALVNPCGSPVIPLLPTN